MYYSDLMANKVLRVLLCCLAVAVWSSEGLSQRSDRRPARIPPNVLLTITRVEDERRWDNALRTLLNSRNAAIRARAALAAGRIGHDDSITPLTELLNDADPNVRSMAAFALGETESPAAANALEATLKNSSGELRARAIEALGKIAGALPREQEALQKQLGAAIITALKSETVRSSPLQKQFIIFGLTAALRSRPADAGPTIAKFLSHSDSRVRADAGNALARLRLKDGNDKLRLLITTDPDPIVRANAARVLGATEDTQSFEGLISHATVDPDSRVRVSAIRALAPLKNLTGAALLLRRGQNLIQQTSNDRSGETNEVLEIATTLGRLLAQKNDQQAIEWLRKVNENLNRTAPEVEIALVRIAPSTYLADLGGTSEEAKRKVQETILLNWRAASGLAAGLGEFAALPDSVSNKAELATSAQNLLRGMLDYRNSGLTINTLVAVHSEYAIPDVLRALAAFKPQDMAAVARAHLKDSDVVVRGTAADILGDLPPSEENTRALGAAFPQAISDVLNDAALSILDALGKQKTDAANKFIMDGLGVRDHLIRRRAVALLKANGVGDVSIHIGIVQTRNTAADYKRALGRIGRNVRAVVTTSKGSFTMELLPDAAPLTVDNFVQLAQRGYYRNVTIHRVVPNFVIQDGDPRGDGNGGPGYQIRCEINEVLYDRAVVGMALSGKDTGGSQWFVTHSPQPHLDGGYTVFGRVVAGMDVVDKIVRGDIIQSIAIRQRPGR